VKKNTTLRDEYTTAIQTAAYALQAGDMLNSLVRIRAAMSLNMDAPEPHNLLGVLYEMKGDDDAARRHYRAAYALDPAYKPACCNIERLVRFEWGRQDRRYDFGVVLPPAEESSIPEPEKRGLNRESFRIV
jgi:hypothetical protein